MGPQPVEGGVWGVALQRGAVEEALLDGAVQEGGVAAGDGVVGEEGRSHVDEVGPELGGGGAVGDGAAGEAGGVVEEGPHLAGTGGEVGEEEGRGAE